MKYYLRTAGTIALLGATISTYGIYRWLSEARAEVPGVSCFTGQYPALVPVK